MRKLPQKNSIKFGLIYTAILFVCCVFLMLYSASKGSIPTNIITLLRGLFIEYDPKVAVVYDLRIPRIIAAVLSGSALSVSGLLFQSVLKNPLADPAIIGISQGSKLFGLTFLVFFPELFFLNPLVVFLGGFLTYLLIYSLSWKGSVDPIRIILVGIAVSAVMNAFIEILGAINSKMGVSLFINQLNQIAWHDVKNLAIYSGLALFISLFISPILNIMQLEDETVKSLGLDVDKLRLFISLIAVMLSAAVSTAMGTVGFLALIVPHTARKIIGTDYRVLLPFTMILGATVMLMADTIGRTAFVPYEISPNVIMSIIGGPFFIFLLKISREENAY